MDSTITAQGSSNNVARRSSSNSGTNVKIDTIGDERMGIDTKAIPPGSNPVYERKVAVMNQALIDLGMGSFQWKVFAMTGFGWFVDNVRQANG